MKPYQIWPEQCAAAREIQAGFGTDRAITYLVGEKFINFLDAAETDEEFRRWPWIEAHRLVAATAADDSVRDCPAYVAKSFRMWADAP